MEDRTPLSVSVQCSEEPEHPPTHPPPLKKERIFSKQDPLSPLKRDPLSNAK